MSFVEHFVWSWLPEFTFQHLCFWVGLGIVLVGHVFRIGAEINAGSSFNHLIQMDKSRDVLVTGGFYAFCRHPSYFGWFLWSVGTQVMMGHLVCTVGFWLASVQFFRYRIQ